MNSKVSIVVPTYNVEDYLEECLDSIVNQTIKDIEIICVNDGSTDSSLDIIKKYASDDNRFVIIDKENGGYGMAMNIGMAKATGEYIGIVEPDDYVSLTMFEELYSLAKENELDFVKADFFRFKHDEISGRLKLKYYMLDDGDEYYNKLLNPSETPLLTFMEMNTWTGIYKNDFLKKHDIKHNETPGASFQDNGFFWLTSVFAKRAMFVNRPMYRNRRDNQNSSVKNKEKVYCMNVEYDYIENILMQYEDIWNVFKYYFEKKRFKNYIGTIKRIDSSFRKEYINNISKELKQIDDRGLFEKQLFTTLEYNMLTNIINSPEKTYSELLWASTATQQTIKSVKNSRTYKVGEKVLVIPKKIKRIFK